ncbi:MAG: exopolysaccharide biosynthesis protein, partial [Chlorobi bacterium OLB5]
MVGDYGGIMRTTNGGIGITQISTEIPFKHYLYQNYPNPFNPVTKIRFQIPPLNLPFKGGDNEGAVLKIYDILGKEIAVLVNEELSPGTYEVNWDASNYSSGVYFYSLKTDNFLQTKKDGGGKMKKFILLLTIFSIEVFSQSLAPVQSIFMQGNNINSVFRTDGYFNYDKISFPSGNAGFNWPATAPQGMTAVFTSGIWIGAKVGPQRELRLAASFYNTHYSPGNIPVIGQVPPSSVCSDPTWRGYYVQLTDPSLFNGGTRYKTAGGRQYTFNYDSWANWPVQKGAPYVEVNGIPGYQPAFNGDRPGIGNGMTARPEELLFFVFMDYTNCTNNQHSSELSLPGGTLPIGVEVHQLVFNFNCFPLRDMYFVKYRIINKSGQSWDSTFISFANDPDIGDASDDANGCDTVRNLVYQYNFDNNDQVYGMNPPALGMKVIQSPIRNTGLNSDTAKLPYDTLIGFRLTGLTGYTFFVGGGNECTGDPDIAEYAYNFMRGKDGCGNIFYNFVTGKPTSFKFSGDACNRTGWFDSSQGDSRGLFNMGPVTMQSGDTQ